MCVLWLVVAPCLCCPSLVYVCVFCCCCCLLFPVWSSSSFVVVCMCLCVVVDFVVFSVFDVLYCVWCLLCDVVVCVCCVVLLCLCVYGFILVLCVCCVFFLLWSCGVFGFVYVCGCVVCVCVCFCVVPLFILCCTHTAFLFCMACSCLQCVVAAGGGHDTGGCPTPTHRCCWPRKCSRGRDDFADPGLTHSRMSPEPAPGGPHCRWSRTRWVVATLCACITLAGARGVCGEVPDHGSGFAPIGDP